MSDRDERLLERSVYPEDREALQRVRCRKGTHFFPAWNYLSPRWSDKPNVYLWEISFCQGVDCFAEARRPLPRHPPLPVIYHSTPRLLPNVLHDAFIASLVPLDAGTEGLEAVVVPAWLRRQ